MSQKFATESFVQGVGTDRPGEAIMGIDWNERWKRRTEDEDLFRTIQNGDYRTALTEMFKQQRGVTICEHGNMTTYQPCPQCNEELDRLGL
jgi:hypothetical protein